MASNFKIDPPIQHVRAIRAEGIKQWNNAPPPRRAFRSNSLILGAGALVLALVLSACSPPAPNAGYSPSSSPVTPIVSSATIWFHPQPPSQNGSLGSIGSTDFLSLFQANAPWPRVMAHTQAFGLYATWIYGASDQELQTMVTFLNAHQMGIEIEAPALQALSTCGTGIEGLVPFGLPNGLNLYTFTLGYLNRLKALGANVFFVKADEPYYYGTSVADATVQKIAQMEGKPAPVSCNFSVSQVSSDIAHFAQLVKSVYPGAAVGDTEPVNTSDYSPDAPTVIDQWHDNYRSVTGAPFPFFAADVNFNDPTWPTLVKAVETGSRVRGIKFGIIYIGDRTDTSDATWTGKVMARFQEYQGANGGCPDYVVFQSWWPQPRLALPETDPTTFTGVINAYITATTAH